MKKEELEKIRELRHILHQNPELSCREQGTMKILKDFLTSHTSLEIVDRGSWFYGVKKGESDYAIAFRADMDALPIEETVNLPYGSRVGGVSHKCGHDGHCAVLCGLALALEKAVTEKTIYLVFQPAEEVGKGGRLCASLIPEKGIREVYAFHNLGGYPAGSLVYRRGMTQPASEGIAIRLEGKTSHASEPEKGINPARALADLVLYAGSTGSVKDEDDLLLVTVTGLEAGSGDFGISPGSGKINLTLRAGREDRMKQVEEEILARARKLAGQYGLTMDYEISDVFPETRNHDICLEKVLDCGREEGLSIIEMEKPWRASEDFGYYLKECPGAMFYIGNGEGYPDLHTKDYDFNDDILEKAADLFYRLALA